MDELINKIARETGAITANNALKTVIEKDIYSETFIDSVKETYRWINIAIEKGMTHTKVPFNLSSDKEEYDEGLRDRVANFFAKLGYHVTEYAGTKSWLEIFWDDKNFERIPSENKDDKK